MIGGLTPSIGVTNDQFMSNDHFINKLSKFVIVCHLPVMFSDDDVLLMTFVGEIKWECMQQAV